MERRCPFSVVIITRFPWPECRVSLDAVHEQVRALGGEIVLVDGSSGAIEDPAKYPCVRRIAAGRTDTLYQLMAQGLREARGEIVMLTEDHVAVPPDWCARVLAAHHEHPEADAIGGPIDNGARRYLLDWPNWLITGGGYLPPMTEGPSADPSGAANLSFKRRALPAEYPPEGMADYQLKSAIRARGGLMWVDPTCVVSHIQSKPSREMVWHHMTAGRSSTAQLHRNTPPAARRREGWRRLLTSPYAAARSTYHLMCMIFRSKPKYRMIALVSLPGMLLLRMSHALGEALALLRGPGDESWMLR